MADVKRTLLRFNPQKAAEPDNFTEHVLRRCTDQLADAFRDISLSTTVIPNMLQSQYYHPLCKVVIKGCSSMTTVPSHTHQSPWSDLRGSLWCTKNHRCLPQRNVASHHSVSGWNDKHLLGLTESCHSVISLQCCCLLICVPSELALGNQSIRVLLYGLSAIQFEHLVEL